MRCPKCNGIMRSEDLYAEEGKCTSWTCYRCGEVIDTQILINRRVLTPDQIQADHHPILRTINF